MYNVAQVALELVDTRKYNRFGHGSEALGYYKSKRLLKKKPSSVGFKQLVVVSVTTQVEDDDVFQRQTARIRFRMKQVRDQTFANKRVARIAVVEVVVKQIDM